jgi:tetratricopeptide (TPR) repeat protein
MDRRTTSAVRRRMRLPAAALVAAVHLLAPAPARAQGCSLPGGAQWSELRSAHFIVDLPAGKADPQKVVALLEELHAAVLAALVGEPVQVPGRVRVIALPSHGDLTEITRSREIEGLFWVSALEEPTILVTVGTLDALPDVVAHELAHHVSYYLFPRQPRWFAEGLAAFVETVARPDKQGRRWAGRQPESAWAANRVGLTPMESLLRWRAGGLLDDPQTTSWLLYRYLWNEHGKRFAEFERRLSDGEAPPAAWKAAFPEWDPAAGKLHLLDRALDRYRRTGRGLAWEVTLPAVDRPYTTAAASPADVHMALLGAKLFRTNSTIAREVRRTVAAEANRDDTANPLAVAELAQLDGASPVPWLRASVAAWPADGRAWYLLARALDAGPEREEALRRAVAAWPEGALPHAALAAEHARAGRPGDAVRSVNRALELAPWSARIIGAAARVALDLGKCPQALALAARAADVAAGRGSVAESSRAQLEETTRRCAAPAAPDVGGR